MNTLPVSLGVRKTRNLLTAMHLFSHLVIGVALIHGALAFEPLIVLYSFVCGLICIQKFAHPEYEEFPSQKMERTLLVDGESTSITGLRIAGYLIA